MLQAGKGRAPGRQAPVREVFGNDPQAAAMATSNTEEVSGRVPFPRSTRRCVPRHEQGRGAAENGGEVHGTVGEVVREADLSACQAWTLSEAGGEVVFWHQFFG